MSVDGSFRSKNTNLATNNSDTLVLLVLQLLNEQLSSVMANTFVKIYKKSIFSFLKFKKLLVFIYEYIIIVVASLGSMIDDARTSSELGLLVFSE